LGIILDNATRTQVVFGGGTELIDKFKPKKGEYGHCDDIEAFAMSQDRQLVATG